MRAVECHYKYISIVQTEKLSRIILFFSEIPCFVHGSLATKPLSGSTEQILASSLSLLQLASAGYVQKCCNCALFWVPVSR